VAQFGSELKGADMTEDSIERAIEAATRLSDLVGRDGTEPAYRSLEAAVREFEAQGYPIEAIIPQGADPGLGFSLKSVTGSKFYKAYKALLRDRLCASDGEFNRLLKANLSSSIGAILTALVTGLGLPVFALGIAIPLAVLIANTGLDAFCDVAKED
jgi:hypothetical protein